MKSFFSTITKKEIIFLSVIVLIGAYLRLLSVFDMTFAYTYDVGRDLLEVHKIAYQLDIPLIGPTTGLSGLFYGPWWYYMLVPAMLVGGGNPQYLVAFMAIVGLLTVILGFVLGKILQGSLFGLLIALLIALSPSLISLSTQIWNPNVAPVFLVAIFIGLFLLVGKKDLSKEIKRDKRTVGLFIFLGMLSGLSIDSEVVYGLLLTAAIFIYLLYYYRLKIWIYLSFIAGLLIIFSPRIFFELRHDFIMTKTILINFGQTRYSSEPFIFSKQLIYSLNLQKGVWDDAFGLRNQLLGWVLLLIVILIIIRYYKSFSHATKQLVAFSFITISTYFIGLTFFKEALWGHYAIGLPVLYIFLFSLALSTLLQNKKFKYVAIIFLVVLMLVQIRPDKQIQYYTTAHAVGDASVYKNQIEVMDYVYENAGEKKFSVLVYTPPVRDYTYQYLFKWYGQREYGHKPTQSDAEVLFVIIEPDTGYEDRLKVWLEEKKHIGKIVQQKSFPSGIMVQTRLL